MKGVWLSQPGVALYKIIPSNMKQPEDLLNFIDDNDLTYLPIL